MTGFYKTLNTCTLGFVTVRHSSLQADFVKIPNKIMRQNIFFYYFAMGDASLTRGYRCFFPACRSGRPNGKKLCHSFFIGFCKRFDKLK